MAYRYPRHALPLVEQALEYARVVLLLGPRQAGKSTLAAELVRRGRLREILSLDDHDSRRIALEDPTGMIGALKGPVAIDEVQRAPDLLLAIKQNVDRDERPGRFLLTGSANILTAPRILDALTGRTDIVRLWPLAMDEIRHVADSGLDADSIQGAPRNLVDRLFDSDPPEIRNAAVGPEAWLDEALLGGFPEVRARSAGRPRRQWYEAYVTSIVERDLRDLSQARKLAEVPKLLEILAGQVASTLVVSRISQRTGIAERTVTDYLRLLETIFAVRTLPAWRPGVAHRERRAAKIVFADTGLLAHVLDTDATGARKNPAILGALFENFAVTELLKHLDWSDRHGTASHYRRDNLEIDLVIERRAGDFIAIETKASSSLGHRDRKALAELRDARPKEFKAGFVLYTGPDTKVIGDRLWALPVSALWSA